MSKEQICNASFSEDGRYFVITNPKKVYVLRKSLPLSLTQDDVQLPHLILKIIKSYYDDDCYEHYKMFLMQNALHTSLYDAQNETIVAYGEPENHTRSWSIVHCPVTIIDRQGQIGTQGSEKEKQISCSHGSPNERWRATLDESSRYVDLLKCAEENHWLYQ